MQFAAEHEHRRWTPADVSHMGIPERHYEDLAVGVQLEAFDASVSVPHLRWSRLVTDVQFGRPDSAVSGSSILRRARRPGQRCRRRPVHAVGPEDSPPGYGGPTTVTGVEGLLVVPSPNSPWKLSPQHLAAPLVVTAHKWLYERTPTRCGRSFEGPILSDRRASCTPGSEARRTRRRMARDLQA